MKTAETSSLKDALSHAAGALSAESFQNVARAAFSSEKRRQELEKMLADWNTVASSFDGTKTDAKVLAGYLNYLRGDLEEAEAALKGEKSHPWGAFHYIHVLVGLDRLEDALKVAEDAAKKQEDFEPLQYALAEVLCKTGREEEGRKLIEERQARGEESSEWHCVHGYCLERSGRYREAIDSYRKAVALDDQNAKAWFRLGYLLDLHGTDEEEEREEAIQAYEACLKIMPLHTNAIINLGLLYEDRERYHDAAKCYELVLKSFPNHPRARLYLGDAIAATRMFYDRDQEKKADRHSQILKIPVTDFELSVRSRNCLQKMNIETLGDLIMKTEQELLSYKNFGETSLKEIKDMLTQKGLRLGQGLEDQGKDVPAGRNPLEATAPAEMLDRPIEDLNLSVRSRRCMERLEVRSFRDLINKTEVELMSAKNFGMTSLNEIKRKLGEMGLGLRS